MKKLKGVLCLVIAIVFVAAAFAGCGANTAAGGDSTQAATAASSGSTTASAEPTTIEILTYSLPNLEFTSDLPVLAEIEKRANVKIEWQNLPFGDAQDTKFNLVMQSGDLPDLIMWQRKNDIDKYGSQGILIPLEDLIKAQPNIQGAIDKVESEKPGSINKITANDGHMYTIPYITPQSATIGYIWGIRQDWLDNVGMAMPTTTDELYSVLKAFKEKDPNKNGQADEIPLIERNADWYVQFIAGFFGCGPDLYWDDNAQTTKYTPYQPEFKAAMEYIQKLYKEKLLDNEYLTNTDDQYMAKMTNNKAGMMFGWKGGNCGAAAKALADQDPAYKLVPMLPVSAPGTKGLLFGGQQRMFYRACITKDCQNVEAVMKFMNYIFGQEGSDLLNWGIQGKTYEVYGAKKSFLPYILTNPDNLTPGDAMDQFGMRGSLPHVYDADAIASTELPFGKEAAKLYDSVPGIVKEDWVASQTEDENKQLTKYQNDIWSAYAGPEITKFITGKNPMTKWEEFTAKLKELGMEDMIKIYDTAYRRTNNIK